MQTIYKKGGIYFMDPDFYVKRTQKLLLSGYPIELSTFDCTLPDAPIVHWHWHDEIEFQYVVKGNAYITCNEKNLSVSEGDIIFVNQAVRHFITPSENGGGIFYCIVVHPSFLLGYGQLELESKYISPVISSQAFSCLHITSNNKMYQQFLVPLTQLITLNTEHPVGYELLSKSYLLLLWKLIYDQLPTISLASPSTTARTANQDAYRVKQAILYIQEHFMDPITLTDISDAILVSKSECCRCFKRVTGLSPIEYLMRYRIMESAKYMYRKTHESISEIAGIVGFNNTSYFNKVFKKTMGCTPTEYRQSLQEEQPKLT